MVKISRISGLGSAEEGRWAAPCDTGRGSIMRKRPLWVGFALLLSILFILQGCSGTKVYELAKPGEKTATLTFPDFIEIDSLDDESVEGLFAQVIYEGQKEIIFPPGTHRVEMRYYGIWDIDDDDHEKVISAYMTLEFNSKPGKAYKVRVNAPKNRAAAHELAAHFNPSIVESQTGTCVSRRIGD